MLEPHLVVEVRRVLVGARSVSTTRRERLVVDLDQLGRVARQLSGRRDDGDDGLADVAHLPTASA